VSFELRPIIHGPSVSFWNRSTPRLSAIQSLEHCTRYLQAWQHSQNKHRSFHFRHAVSRSQCYIRKHFSQFYRHPTRTSSYQTARYSSRGCRELVYRDNPFHFIMVCNTPHLGSRRTKVWRSGTLVRSLGTTISRSGSRDSRQRYRVAPTTPMVKLSMTHRVIGPCTMDLLGSSVAHFTI
jgi:hypothetical protein